ncbi:hypothetical protein PG999_014171 [Apiospora kogelbergensis]|uniref:Uncharacterized protein n=1 Tax=Apiospora kogelbergensis TaxID=1337665 RepID=A0AAW0QC53_9PEZI
MQFTTILSTATVGLLSLALGATASPVGQPAAAAAVEARSAWMFEYCDGTGLSGSCHQKSDDGNVQVCQDIAAAGGAQIKSVKTFSGFDCWTYKDSGCTGLATRYVKGTYDNPAAFKTWRCYTA